LNGLTASASSREASEGTVAVATAAPPLLSNRVTEAGSPFGDRATEAEPVGGSV
jgi:hypothetical protein